MNQLTKRADRILKLAKDIAHEYRQGYVGTEHLLLAILREGTGLGARVLIEHGATLQKVEQEIAKQLQARLHETWVMGRLPGTPHFQDVLTCAARESKGTGNWQICSIHLLLALLAQRDSIGYKALHALGLSADMVRRAMVRSASVGAERQGQSAS